jgi:hypothetical protein
MSWSTAEIISGQLRTGGEGGLFSGVVNHLHLLPHFQLISHPGACGKTGVMPQNRWPKAELTESGVAKCVSCRRRVSRAERSDR